MPYADPDRAAAYNREWWSKNGRAYRANLGVDRLPPISRQQCLDQDIAQERALAVLEAKRGRGYARAAAQVKEFIERERRWIRLTSSRFVIEGTPSDD